MPLVTVPPALPSPLPHDAIDNEIPATRAAVIAVAEELNAKEARLAALEAAGPPPTPTPVVIVAITAAQEAALTAVASGSVAILRAEGSLYEFTMVRV